jgi:D-sedoheptulose 7-phosphate isomerase
MNGDTIALHFAAHQQVAQQSLRELQPAAARAADALIKALRSGGKVIAFGNGGSATQASHLVAELIGRFIKTGRAFPAIALAGDAGTITCIGNDFGYDALFERQVMALAQPGDAVLGFTTSGRSENVLRGLSAARERGAVTIALTGAAGLSAGTANHILAVPSSSTPHIQEVHLMLLHVWCVCIDEALRAV